MPEIKDSGTRMEFETGAVRDIQKGKGRCDLLPLGQIAELLGGEDETADPILFYLDMYVHSKDKCAIYRAIRSFGDKRKWTVCDTILEVSKHYEDGAAKYGEHNWEKGLPTHCYLNSGIRHYLKWYRGDDDEPHDRAFVWNMLGLLWTLENRPELDDIQKMD